MQPPLLSVWVSLQTSSSYTLHDHLPLAAWSHSGDDENHWCTQVDACMCVCPYLLTCNVYLMQCFSSIKCGLLSVLLSFTMHVHSFSELLVRTTFRSCPFLPSPSAGKGTAICVFLPLLVSAYTSKAKISFTCRWKSQRWDLLAETLCRGKAEVGTRRKKNTFKTVLAAPFMRMSSAVRNSKRRSFWWGMY